MTPSWIPLYLAKDSRERDLAPLLDMAGDDRRRNWKAGVARDATDINILMLRFRPIAPKPPETGEPSNSVLGKGLLDRPGKTKSKKKCTRVRRQGCRSASTECKLADMLEHHEKEASGETRTLQLIPDQRDEESSPSVKASEGEPDPFWIPAGSSSSGSRSGFLGKNWVEDESNRLTPPACLVIPKIPLPDLNNAAFPSTPPDPTVGTSMVPHKRVLDMCLIVETVVMDASCIHGVEQLLGHTDEERLTALAADTCPEFVSDADNLVVWVNGAFERMMMAELAACGGGWEATVRMAAVEDLSTYSSQALTSRVRIQYTWRDNSCPVWRGPRVVTVAPCDAWRLDSGGFAWRLDINSALSLGR